MSAVAPFPKFRAFDADGLPLAGGKLWTYAAGTSTEKATYVSASGSANTNPVVLDANGEADVWLSGTYKFVLYDADDVLQWTVDNLPGLDGLQQAEASVTPGSGQAV